MWISFHLYLPLEGEMAEKKAPQHNVTIKWETVSLISVQKTQPLSKKKTETSSIILEQKKSYTTEFRNFDDDAWYTVMVTMEGKQTLRIKYEKFSDEEDQLFEPSFFESLEALHEFEKRFRPLSVQVQDYECRKLVHGVKVCASQHFIPDDLRFYDAIVDAVRSFLLFF